MGFFPSESWVMNKFLISGNLYILLPFHFEVLMQTDGVEYLFLLIMYSVI